MDCRHPEITVKLIGRDGNAFAILGAVTAALKKAGHKEAAAEYQKLAMSGDYNNLLCVTMDFVNVK